MRQCTALQSGSGVSAGAHEGREREAKNKAEAISPDDFRHSPTNPKLVPPDYASAPTGATTEPAARFCARPLRQLAR